MNSSLTPSRRIIAAAAAATLALGATACGSSNKSGKGKPAVPQHAVSKQAVRAIPLHVPVATVVAKLGPPQRIEQNTGVLPPKHKGGKSRTVPITDYIYGVLGGKPSDSIDLTFYKGKLGSVLIRTTGSAADATATPGAP